MEEKECSQTNLHMIFITILSVPDWMPLYACVNWDPYPAMSPFYAEKKNQETTEPMDIVFVKPSVYNWATSRVVTSSCGIHTA